MLPLNTFFTRYYSDHPPLLNPFGNFHNVHLFSSYLGYVAVSTAVFFFFFFVGGGGGGGLGGVWGWWICCGVASLIQLK